MITKKLQDEIFAWDPNAFGGKGYWFVMGKNGGLGRAASKKEATSLGKPKTDEVQPESPKVLEEKPAKQPKQSQGMGYEKAARIRKTGLLSLIAQKKFEEGQGLGSSIKGAIGDKFKARAKGIKEFFDPLNMVRGITGSGAIGRSIRTVAGRAMGRSDEDIDYFGGYARKKNTAEPVSNASTKTSSKIGDISKGTGAADIVGKLYTLFSKNYEDKRKKDEIEKDFQKERDNESDRRHKELLKALRMLTGGKKEDKKDDKDGGIFGTILAVLADAWEKIGSFGKTIAKLFASIVSKVKNAIMSVVNFIRGIVGKVVDFFMGAIRWVGNKIAEIVSHIPGLGKVAKSVTEFVKDVGAKASGLLGKGAAKAEAKTAEKVAAKTIGKSFLKKIPVLGLAAGLFFGAERALAGDWTGAGLEIASGAAGAIPVIGTAASVGIDVGLAARDAGAFGGKPSGGGSTGGSSTTPTTPTTSTSPPPAPSTPSTPSTASSSPAPTSSAPKPTTEPAGQGSNPKPMSTATPMPVTGTLGEKAVDATNKNLNAQMESKDSTAPVVMNNSSVNTAKGKPQSSTVGSQSVRDDETSALKAKISSVRMV